MWIILKNINMREVAKKYVYYWTFYININTMQTILPIAYEWMLLMDIY